MALLYGNFPSIDINKILSNDIFNFAYRTDPCTKRLFGFHRTVSKGVVFQSAILLCDSKRMPLLYKRIESHPLVASILKTDNDGVKNGKFLSQARHGALINCSLMRELMWSSRVLLAK